MNIQGNNEFDAIDNLIYYMSRMEQPAIQIIDPSRVRSALKVKQLLNDSFAENGNNAHAELSFEPLFGTALVIADTEDLVINDPVTFTSAAIESDNFEIYPLVDGRIRIAFMFFGALRSQ